MQIQIKTDRNIDGHEGLAAQVTGVVENALSRMSDHITRVEVHISDETSVRTMKFRSLRCRTSRRNLFPKQCRQPNPW